MFRIMTSEELAIREIEDIQMIHFYELSHPNGNSSSNTSLLCPAIAVFYDHGKQINLCSEDEYFNLLSEKVYELYRGTEDKSQIITDERTKRLLTFADPLSRKLNMDIFRSDDSVSVPLDSALSKRFIPVVASMLSELYSAVDKSFIYTGCRTGWRGSGVVYATVGGIDSPRYKDVLHLFPFHTIKLRDNLFTITVGGFLGTNGTLSLRLSIEPDHILISYSSKSGDIHGLSQFRFHADHLSEDHSVYSMGRQVFTESSDVSSYDIRSASDPEAMLGVNALLLPKGIAPVAIYSLQFGMHIVLYEATHESADTVCIEHMSAFIYDFAGYADILHWDQIRDKGSGLTIQARNNLWGRLLLNDNTVETTHLR